MNNILRKRLEFDILQLKTYLENESRTCNKEIKPQYIRTTLLRRFENKSKTKSPLQNNQRMMQQNSNENYENFAVFRMPNIPSNGLL